MIKNIVVFIFSIIFLKSHLYSKEIKNLIATEFKNEIKIERVIKIYPSETFKKWDGNYKVILVDKLDKEEFSYIFNEKDSSKDIIKGIEEVRSEKNTFVKNQMKISEKLEKIFPEKFVQMSDIETIYGDRSSAIEFYLEKDFFKDKSIKYCENLFRKISLNIPINYSVYINASTNSEKIKKSYYSYSDDGFFYRFNMSSFGSNADFFVSRKKFNSPMNSLNPNLKIKFINLNNKISSQNYFFKNTELFIEILRQGRLYESLEKKLKNSIKDFQFVCGYLDVYNGKVGIRGVITNRFLDEDATNIYEFFYTIENQELKILK